MSPREQELKDLKESLQDTQPVGVLVDSCRTMDQVSISDRASIDLAEIYDPSTQSSAILTVSSVLQAKGVLKFIEAISEKTLRSTVALTAARGRGKSAALGLAVAGAVAFGYGFAVHFLSHGCKTKKKKSLKFLAKTSLTFFSDTRISL